MGETALAYEFVLEETEEKSAECVREILAVLLMRRLFGTPRVSIGSTVCGGAMPLWPAPGLFGPVTFATMGISTDVSSVLSSIGIFSTFSFSEIDESGMPFCCTIGVLGAGAGVVVMLGDGFCVCENVELEGAR
jgi:hypothetical protein